MSLTGQQCCSLCGIDKLQTFIKNHESSFLDVDNLSADKKIIAGYKRVGSSYFLMLPNALLKACGNQATVKSTLNALREQGFLNTQSNGKTDPRLKGRMHVGGRRIRGYLIYNSFVDVRIKTQGNSACDNATQEENAQRVALSKKRIYTLLAAKSKSKSLGAAPTSI